MRAWLAVVVASLTLASRALAQDEGGPGASLSLDLFGARSSVTFGVSVHTHRARRVAAAPVLMTPSVLPAVAVVQPTPVVVSPPPLLAAPIVVQPAPVVVSPPPLLAVLPSTAVVQGPPVVVSAPPPPVVAVAQPAAPRPSARPESERPALIAVKYQPGLSGLLSASPTSVGFSEGGFVHGGGLEARLTRWFALRSDVELNAKRRAYDVLGAKLWLAGAEWKVKPFVSASLSASESELRPRALSIGVVGSGGVDVFFGRHFFLTAEVKVRAAPEACCSTPQVTGSAGAGLAFF